MSQEPTKETHRLIGCLEYNPEVAKWLGVFLAEFAAVEFMLVRLMALILAEDDNMRVSHKILGHIRSISDRTKRVAKAAKGSNLDPERKKLLKNFTADILKLNSIRNDYVHGLYETNVETGDVTLTTWVTSSTRPTGKPTPVTATKIQEDAMAVRKLNGRIAEALFPRDVKPNHSADN